MKKPAPACSPKSARKSFGLIIAALPEALAAAITGNFWISAGVGLVALLAVVTLREKRLRTGEHDDAEESQKAAEPAFPITAAANGSGSAANGAAPALNGASLNGMTWVARTRPQRSL